MPIKSVRFGVNTWTWVSPCTTEDCARLIPLCQKMGFDLVEIALEDPIHIDPVAVRAMLEENGMGVALCGAFGPGRDLASDDDAEARASLSYIAGLCNTAEKLGATIIAGPMYSAVGKARHVEPDQRLRERDRAARNLAAAGSVAANSGVRLAVEPLNRFETDLVNTAAQVRDLVQVAASPAVGIHLDTFHMNIEESSVLDAVHTAGSLLWHVHASESHRGTPGSGLAAWDHLRQGLDDVDYHGDIVIETFTPAVKAIARAAAIWRPLAESQDALARDGLAFLHDLFGRAR